ncbi:MAG: hypothetical protein ACREH6_09485 [Geminicoccaceae bacterium]
MASALGAEAEDFARRFLETVEARGRDGGWVKAREAFELTIEAHPEHPYVAHVQEKPARKIGLAAVVERLREREFPHVERRKAGTRRNAPVYYRTGRPDPVFELHLPYEVPQGHPLHSQPAEARRESRQGLRRAALATDLPKSPWRRRLLVRRTDTGELPFLLNGPSIAWWQQLLGHLRRLAGEIRFVLTRS